jgi:hypothetical protein
MICNMKRIHRPRGRPRFDKYLGVDIMIIAGATELLRVPRYHSLSGAIREFVRRLWSGDVCAVLTALAAFDARLLDDVLKEGRVVVSVGGRRVVVDDLDQFRPQAIGANPEAVCRRVLRRLEPTVTHYRGGVVVSKPLCSGVWPSPLDRRRGPRRALVEAVALS